MEEATAVIYHFLNYYFLTEFCIALLKYKWTMWDPCDRSCKSWSKKRDLPKIWARNTHYTFPLFPIKTQSDRWHLCLVVLRQVKEVILRAVLSITRFRPPLMEQCKQIPVKCHPCHTPANEILNKSYSLISYFQKSVRNKFLFRCQAKQTWNNGPQIFFKCHTYQNHCKWNTINKIL